MNVLPEPVTPSSSWLRSSDLTPATSSLIAFGWSPFGSNGETMRNGTPPSDFSGRGGRCGTNGGVVPATIGWLANDGCRASTAVALASRSPGSVNIAVNVAVMLSPSGRGAYWRNAGSVDGPTAYVACWLSAKPGVNAAVSTGGALGLLALPRDRRGFSGRGGVVGNPDRSGGVDLGGRAMPLYATVTQMLQSQVARRISVDDPATQ